MKLACKNKGTDFEDYYIVDDSYDFAGNSATDETTIENVAEYGALLIGRTSGYKDWKSHRDLLRSLIETSGGADYSTYVANLSASEKYIAAYHIPTKIVDNLGYGQLVSDSGSVEEAKNNIKTYLKFSAWARAIRYEEVVSYAYQRLGKNQGLQIEDTVRQNDLKGKFIDRGTLRTSEDSVDGFEDYFLSTDSFTAVGLLAKLNDGTYTLVNDGSGQTNQEFVNVCVAIIKYGIY